MSKRLPARISQTNMQSLPVIVLFCTSILWGLSWLPLKALYAAGFESISLILLSSVLLSLLLLPFLIRQHQHWLQYKKIMLLIAVLGGAANLSFAYALIMGNVIRVMVLFYLLPIWGVLAGWLVLHERVDRWRLLGVILAIGGAVIVLGGYEIIQQTPQWIDLISLAAGLLLAMLILVFRATPDIPVVSKIASMSVGTFVLAGLMIAVTSQQFIVGQSVAAWLALLAFAVFWLLSANLGSQWAVTQIEVGRSSIIIIVELLVAVVSASWIQGVIPQPSEIIGGLLILAAALIEALRDVQLIKVAQSPRNTVS